MRKTTIDRTCRFIKTSHRKKRTNSPSPDSCEAKPFEDINICENNSSSQASEYFEEDIAFEDYIQWREPKKHRRDLLLHIAPLLRKGCYTLQDLASFLQKPTKRLKKFLDEYEDCI